VYFGQRRDGVQLEGGYGRAQVSCMCGVHDATHSYVSEWSQHMQHLQTGNESVPDLQTAVLTVQVLDSGEYHSENSVSLPIL